MHASSKLFLLVGNLDWLLAYAADELHFQGVKRESPEREPRKPANCAAVADLRLQWDFGSKTWEAEFVSGPFEGTTRRFCVEQLTNKRWSKLV